MGPAWLSVPFSGPVFSHLQGGIVVSLVFMFACRTPLVWTCPYTLDSRRLYIFDRNNHGGGTEFPAPPVRWPTSQIWSPYRQGSLQCPWCLPVSPTAVSASVLKSMPLGESTGGLWRRRPLPQFRLLCRRVGSQSPILWVVSVSVACVGAGNTKDWPRWALFQGCPSP